MKIEYIKTVKQHDSKDCGAACLCSISLYYGKKYSLRFMRSITHTGQNGTSLLGIQDGAKKIGINSEAYYAKIDEFIAYMKTEMKPVIVHFKTNHFVVVYKVKKNKVFISDPAVGKYNLSIEGFQNEWSGYFMTFINSELEKTHYERKNKLNFFAKVLIDNWKTLFIIAIISILLMAMSVCSAYLFQILMDIGQNNTYQYMYNKENLVIWVLSYISRNKSTNLFVFMIILTIMTVIVSLIKDKIQLLLNQRLDISFMDEYITKILRANINEITTRMTGDYITRASDLLYARELLSNMLVSFLINLSLFVLGSLLLCKINKLLYMIALVTLIMYIFLALILHSPFEIVSHSVMSANAEVQTYFKESLQGFEFIRANHLENIIHDQYIDKYSSLKSKSLKGGMLGAYSMSISTLINQLSNLIIIFVGFEFVNRAIISLGELMTFFMLLSLFGDSANQIISMQQSFQRGIVSIDRLSDIMCMEDEVEGEFTINQIKDITVDHIGFSYFNGPILFNDMSFHILGNEKIVIWGKNGCGKSTLLRMIMGLEKASSGMIMVNGMDIEKIKRSTIRERIAFVSQTPFMFANTLFYNVTLGENYPTEEVVDACIHAGLGDLIKQSPETLNMYIEEDATNLSSGQKQSIAIARGLLRKPDVLILDEATCNMDEKRENEVMSYIMSMNNMCIIVTHSETIAKRADYIIKIGENIDEKEDI